MMARPAAAIKADLQQVQDALMQTNAFRQPDEWQRLLQRRRCLLIEMRQAEQPVHLQKTDIQFIYPKTIAHN